MAAKKVAEAGAIAWPPDMMYLAGIEVKCAYYQQGVARSTKGSRQKVAAIRAQIDGLLALGLDRVALLDIIATDPAAGGLGFAREMSKMEARPNSSPITP